MQFSRSLIGWRRRHDFEQGFSIRIGDVKVAESSLSASDQFGLNAHPARIDGRAYSFMISFEFKKTLVDLPRTETLIVCHWFLPTVLGRSTPRTFSPFCRIGSFILPVRSAERRNQSGDRVDLDIFKAIVAFRPEDRRHGEIVIRAELEFVVVILPQRVAEEQDICRPDW